MAIFTKPELATERAKRIVTEHIWGKRDPVLKLGYWIVTTRRSDDIGMAPEVVQAREHLVELFKEVTVRLRSKVLRVRADVSKRLRELEPLRDDPHTRRAYLYQLSKEFQGITSEAVIGNYDHYIFDGRQDLQLLSRIDEISTHYANKMISYGQTRPFSGSQDSTKKFHSERFSFHVGNEYATSHATFEEFMKQYPELQELKTWVADEAPNEGSLMEHIEEVYKLSGEKDSKDGLLCKLFREQTKKWVDITLDHVGVAIGNVHHFIWTVFSELRSNPMFSTILWNSNILKRLMAHYRKIIDHANLLLHVQRGVHPADIAKFRKDRHLEYHTSRDLNSVLIDG